MQVLKCKLNTLIKKKKKTFHQSGRIGMVNGKKMAMKMTESKRNGFVRFLCTNTVVNLVQFFWTLRALLQIEDEHPIKASFDGCTLEAIQQERNVYRKYFQNRSKNFNKHL